jgi:predicted permease
MNLIVWIDNRRAELRYAFRMMHRSPGVSIVAILSLALGIGANTAIFSLIDKLMLQRLPVKAPKELFLIAADPEDHNISWNYPDYVAFRDHCSSFSGFIAGYSGTQSLGMEVAGQEASAATELAHGVIVTGGYFEVLGISSVIGRVFSPEDDRTPGASPYLVLSYDFWQRRFQGDPGVIGLKIRLNSYPFTVVGVAQPGFRGTDVAVSPDLFLPLMMRGEVTGDPFTFWNNRHYWWMQLIGRLQPGHTARQAEAELYALYRGQEEEERRTAAEGMSVSKARPIVLLPAARGYSRVRERMAQPLLIMMVVVGLVLLIASVNVANLMLARGAARQREIAVRLAMGATRARLTGQMLVESILIALIGGAVGLVFAYVGVDLLVGFVPRQGMGPIAIDGSPDLRLLAFTCAVALLTGLLFGTVPALQSTRPSLVPALKEEAPGAAGPARHRLRSVLVVAQAALSLLLLIGAALFVRSLGNLHHINPGFRSDNTWVIQVDPSRNGYKGQRLRDFYERLRASCETLPGVQSLSLATIVPLGGMRWSQDFAAEGHQWQEGDTKSVDLNAVGPRYFETMGIPLLLGRDFRDSDNPPYSVDPPTVIPLKPPGEELPGPRVVIVSESMARHFFAGKNPVGMHLCLEEEYRADRAYEIIGVVKDVHYFGLREAVEPMVYMPVWRGEIPFRALCIHTSHNLPAIVEGVRRKVSAIDSGIPVLSARTMQQQIDSHILEDRIIATVSSFFGVLALLLAGVGMYGVISYTVTRRTREIGIRMALGAQRASIQWLVLRDSGLLVLAGAVIGIPAALAASRLIRATLYGVAPQDPLAIVLATAALAAVAAIASFLPARRAARVDPIVALHME